MSNQSTLPIYTITGERQFLRKELISFLLLATLMSWTVTLIIITQIPSDFQTGSKKAVEELFGNLPMIFGLGPLVSAIIITAIYRGRVGLKELLKRVVLWRVSPWWFLVALILPIIPHWIGLLLWGKLTNTVLVLPVFTNYLSSWLQIAFISTIYFIAEEFGWRGFMLPRVLSTHPWIKASLITGIVWAVWHYPLWIISFWATTGAWTEASVMVMASSVFGISVSILLTWIFKNTRGSILLAMLFHGSNNANMGKMYEIAGDAALTGPDFQIVQASVMLCFVLMLLLIMRNQYKEQVRSE